MEMVCRCSGRVTVRYAKDDPDTDNDGMSDGWEVAHGLNPLDSGEAEEAEEESGSTNQADGAEVSNESDSWPDPTKESTVTLTTMVSPTSRKLN